MALTAFQRDVLRLLAPSRLERESFVAGGVALNTQLSAARRSRDIDLFHDTIEALAMTLTEDRKLLAGAGYELHFLREAPTLAEAVLSRNGESTLIGKPPVPWERPRYTGSMVEPPHPQAAAMTALRQGMWRTQLPCRVLLR